MKTEYIIMIIGMIILSLLIGGCSVKWQPIVDPRVGENYTEITRDILECRELTKPIKNKCLTKPYWECQKKEEALRICLANRGHSVLN